MKFVFTFFCVVALISCANGQHLLADFETDSTIPTLSNGASVVDNPDQSGNTSARVALFSKPTGNWKSVSFTFATVQNVGLYNQLKFKLRSSTKGRVYVKIYNGSTVILESWAPSYGFMPEAATWTECLQDIASISNQSFDKIEINASVDNEAAASIYIDDIRLTHASSPNGEPVINVTISQEQITAGESIYFDASASFDLEGSIVLYAWNFNDGSTGTGSEISHIYTTDGIYTATVTATDNDGKKAVKKLNINVFPATGKLGRLTFTTATAVVHERVEGIFLVNDTYSNLYDPHEVKVDAFITLPDQATITVPCFFYEKAYYNVASDTWTKEGSAGYWMMRFSSSQSGTHLVRLQLTDSDGIVSSSQYPVQVSSSQHKGYIRMDAQNKQYFRHSTGEPYYPLGINVAWDEIADYTTIFANLGNSGANLVRYWQVPFNRQALEWKNGSGFYKGLGIYSQEAAAEQDSIISLCEQNNIYLQLTLFQHGMFSETVNSNWSDNPYNSANGGPLTKAEQYFYNEAAKARTKKLLRYIVARWGYSVNLFAWELFNEVNFTGAFPNQTIQWYPGVKAWHDEMGQYIKSLDAFDHPVTSSSDESHLADFDKLNGLDNVQYHLYNTSLLTEQVTIDKRLLGTVTRTGVINGEYGTDVTLADVPFDQQRVSIWTGIMTQVPHLMWKWDNYVNAEWAQLFQYPAQFLQDVDFAKEETLADWTFNANYSSSKLVTVGLKSDQNYYALVYDASNRTNLSNVTCDFSRLPLGNYTITLYNVLTGEVTSVDKDIFPPQNSFVLPAFSKAVVLKLKFNSAIVLGAEQTQPLSGITVSPNPSVNSIQIDWSAVNADNITVKLYDSQGGGIYSTSVQRNESAGNVTSLQLSRYNLQPGIYIVQITVGKDSITKKIVYLRE